MLGDTKGSYCRTLSCIILIHRSNCKLRSSACSRAPAAPRWEMSKMSAGPFYLVSSGGESISTGMRKQKDSGPNRCDLECESELAFRQSKSNDAFHTFILARLNWRWTSVELESQSTELLLADRCVSTLTYAWQTEQWGKGWSSHHSTRCQVEMNSTCQA